MMFRHDFLLLGMAVVLLVTNCLGAAFTIRRIRSKERKGEEPAALGPPASHVFHR